MQKTIFSPTASFARYALPLCAVAAGLLHSGTASAQSINYTEDFEAPRWEVGNTLGNKNGWIGNNSTSGSPFAVAIQKPTSGSSQSLYLKDNGAGTPYASYDFDKNLISGSVSFDFSREAGDTFALTFRKTGASPTSEADRTFGFLIENSTFKLRAFNYEGSNHRDVATLSFADAGYSYGEQGDFSTFTIAFDTGSKTVTFSLGEAHPFITFTNNAVANWDWGNLTFGAGWGGGTNISGYFDNVNVQGVIPEPSAYAALGAALSLAAVALIRRRTA